MSSHKLSFKNFLSYGFGDFGFNLMFQVTSLYLLIFYTDLLGLGAASAGSIFLIARLWDGINDPIMGWVAERTRTRWGTYRPYLLFGAIPLGLSLILLFYIPDLDQTGKYIYALATYIFFGMAFTAVNIPYGALTASLTADYEERSKLTGYRMTLGIVGGMVAAALSLPVITAFTGLGNGYFYMAIAFALIAIVCIWLAFFGVKEKIKPTLTSSSIFSGLGMLKSNRPFITLTACFVLNFAALSLISGMVPYYFEYYLGEKELQSVALGLVFGMAAISIPVWVWISKKTSKKQVYILGGIIYAFALVGIYFVPRDNLIPMFILFAFQGIGAGSSAFAGWAMLPDTVEYGEWKTGVRAEGSVYGIYGVFFKLGIGVGIWMASTGLASFGYIANTVQTESAAQGIRMLQTIGPAVLIGLSLVAVSFYSLSPGKYAEILEELSTRKNGIET